MRSESERLVADYSDLILRLSYTYLGSIHDADGKAVDEGSAASAEIIDGQAVIGVDLGSIERGSYTLIITAFVSEKKADQPLEISGNWECTFTW